MTTLGITRRPAGQATAEVRRVATPAEFLEALEIDWEAFAVPASSWPNGAGRRSRRGRRSWPTEARAPTSPPSTESPAGFARAVFTPGAALLMGGATLARARRRGVYTSTVLARWHEAVERGVPRLATSAGPMSAPVLERLGFARLGGVQVLRDRL